MYVQTEETPNPNTLKFLPGKTVSEVGSIVTLKQGVQNLLCYYVSEVKSVEAI